MTTDAQNQGGEAPAGGTDNGSDGGDAAAFDAFVDGLGMEEPSVEEVQSAVDGAAAQTPSVVGGMDGLPPQPGETQPVAQTQTSGVQPTAVQPAQSQEVQPPAQAAPASAAPVDFETFVTQNMDKVVKHLADTQFALTNQEKEVMGDAAPVVASYMARSQVNNMRIMMSALNNALPAVVGQYVQTMAQAKIAEDEFFGEYPALKEVDRNTLFQIGQHLKNTQPSLKGADFRKTLAATVAASRGIQMQQAPAAAQGKAPQVAPFQSAGAGAGAASIERIPAQGGQAKPVDPLQQLFDGLLDDD
jgi:hypothetical protein